METRRDVFQAIADPTRRDILCLLAERSRNVSIISEEFKISRQAVSLHLKILQECGMISIQQEGRERVCELRPQKLSEVDAWIEPFRKIWEKRFQQLDQVLINLKTTQNEK